MLQRFGLTAKVVLLTLVTGGVTWAALDWYSTRHLRATFDDYLLRQLERAAGEDRRAFDEHLRSHHQAARLIASQSGMHDYLMRRRSEGWPEGGPRIETIPPEWYPRSSLMRLFAAGRYALLIDGEQRVREVFSSTAKPPPAVLLDPRSLLMKLSHSGSLMTEVQGEPYLLSFEFHEAEGRSLGGLLLASPLDSTFLYGARGMVANDHLTLLLREGRVLASNDPQTIAPGTAVDRLLQDYVFTGKSFFDQGVSDLTMEFASVMPIAEIARLQAALVGKERAHRTVSAVVLILVFLAVVGWIARSVRRVADGVERFAAQTLGTATTGSRSKDELYQLRERFQAFQQAIVGSRRELALAVERETRAAVEAQERQRYTQELQESNEELRRFAYIISHDLRGPLVNIKGFSGELQRALDEAREVVAGVLDRMDPPARSQFDELCHVDIPESVAFIDSAASRMEALIAAVLKLSRLGRSELNPETLDMGLLVRQSIGALRFQLEERGAVVSVDRLPEVTADRTAMEQVVSNILANAVAYLDPARPGRIEVKATTGDGQVVFHFSDNGRGIRREDRDKVFALFRRGANPDVSGEGMGLSYVQTVLKRHGGRIDFDSEPGRGTTFHVTLPRENRVDG